MIISPEESFLTALISFWQDVGTLFLIACTSWESVLFPVYAVWTPGLIVISLKILWGTGIS